MSTLRELREPLSKLLDVPIGSRGRVAIELELPGERRHRVRVHERGDWLCVEGRVAHVDDLIDRMGDIDLLATTLQANHDTELIAFGRDEDGYLTARADLHPSTPAAVVADTVRRVARVADRWEEVWAGEDRY